MSRPKKTVKAITEPTVKRGRGRPRKSIAAQDAPVTFDSVAARIIAAAQEFNAALQAASLRTDMTVLLQAHNGYTDQPAEPPRVEYAIRRAVASSTGWRT